MADSDSGIALVFLWGNCSVYFSCDYSCISLLGSVRGSVCTVVLHYSVVFLYGM